MNKAAIVLTKSGKKGYVYWHEQDRNPKLKVRVIDQNFKETGALLLCSADTVKTIGYKD